MEPQVIPPDGYGVLLIGEALGADEAEVGRPFVGKAGFKLTRLIEWAGLDRNRFGITNIVWCRPPDNKLEGTYYESSAISHCRSRHWEGSLSGASVLVPMGNVALGALTGRKGILAARGYVGAAAGKYIVPTVHPSFIQRGQSKYSAAFIHDIQKAVRLAQDGLPVEPTNYLIDPLPYQAEEWAFEYERELARNPLTRLAYDIETPGKGQDEGEVSDEDDPTYFIHRIGFSFKGLGGLTIPWQPPYLSTIRRLLGSHGEKVVWNAPFDNPRIRSKGIAINGLIHDGMVAWHILHSDLPKGLGFVATFTCPWQAAWKHTSGSSPGLYNCIDADVELRSMAVIEAELRESGLWDVYQRDVIDLDPVLQHMTRVGMPIDTEVRDDRAIKLDTELNNVVREMEQLVPVATRRWSPQDGYVKVPSEAAGIDVSQEGPFLAQDIRYVAIRRTVPRSYCSHCGTESPVKAHFKSYKKPTAKRPQNPCAAASKVTRQVEVVRLARLDDFKLSREQIIRYNEYHGRPTPMTKDKKTGLKRATTDEKAVKTLMGRYPEDEFYKLIIKYRKLDKLAGTYVGRPPT